MKIRPTKGLTFDDVLLVPRRSAIASRRDVDTVTRLTPGMPLSAVSIGKVTSCSTSSGAMPPASVSTVISGLSRSGKTSTGVRQAVIAP